MRILSAFYPIDDMGGIINHNEQMVAGFKELGHEVDTCLFIYKHQINKPEIAGGRASWSNTTNMYFDQRRGYTWPRESVIPYKGDALFRACQRIKGYDLVIWQIPVPTKRKENQGNDLWPELYEYAKRSFAVIHDGNFLDSYPWLHEVRHKIEQLICVHPAGHFSAQHIDIPSKLVYNPHHIDLNHTMKTVDYTRDIGFLSVQTFKAWKHVPELVAAVPHTKDIECHLAGKGIDYYYLTSKDKCKWPGVWDAAIEHGMVYHDVITNVQRDKMLQGLTCLVDNSWSKKYFALGSHFNRTPVEALKQGAIPILRPWGMGMGSPFIHGHNCLVIPQEVDDKEYGEYLNDYCNSERKMYKNLMREALHLLSHFDRAVVCDKILNGEPTQPRSLGAEKAKVAEAKWHKVMKEFFNEA